ncbi:unnamed protein product [Parascedosporium putredinis]|uniref:D-lactate dehydrogenase (cytochrome) n=1 Tax=Parascedosporium putredinis TaxID=1442378 RepID=A0A9P1H9J4_9PEZI|nr:unnamed protein product [Parascedosporium putredinis]CAI8001928.1 unnamed protein product [Parascedosporium putredinis]
MSKIEVFALAQVARDSPSSLPTPGLSGAIWVTCGRVEPEATRKPPWQSGRTSDAGDDYCCRRLPSLPEWADAGASVGDEVTCGERRFHIAPAQPLLLLRAQQARFVSDMEGKDRTPSNEEKTGRSFRGQMMGSISHRLKREKEELERWSEHRQKASDSSRWSLTFALLFTTGVSYYLGTLYPRPPETDSTLPLDKTRPPEHRANVENLQAAWADFGAIVGKEHVSTAETDLQYHSTSAWSSHPAKPSEKPFLVVYPATTEEVPPSAGRPSTTPSPPRTSSSPDPGPGAMIGGMIGTGCSGTNAYHYGTMREWVLSLTVVLADGTVIKTRQRPRKSSAGYDLTKLFIGSEGTLGLVTEATLKVTVKPAHTSVAVASFPSIRDAANCVSRVVGLGIPIAAIEILDDNQMKCINEAGMTQRRWTEAPTLFFKFAGTSEGVKEQVAQVKKLASAVGSKTFEFARNEEEQHDLWSARKEALWSAMAVKKEGDHVWTGDVAVPMSRLPQIIEETKEDMNKSGLFGTIVGHVGDGNFHTILMYSDKERPLAERVVHKMVKRAIELEGTVTGEHGVGLVKRDYLPHELGEPTVDAMRKIKQAFDPLCLLNCDKVVRMQQPKRGEVSEW